MRRGRDYQNGVSYDHETGTLVRRVINVPMVVDREVNAFQEEIFPPDTRQPVTDTTRVPYRFVCHLAINWMDEQRRIVEEAADGTGLLISDRHVLTAGHCIARYSARLKKRVFAKSITVTPGKNTLAPLTKWRPFGHYVITEPKTAHPKWIATQDELYDYGLLTLAQHIGQKTFKAIGDKPLGYWGSKTDGGNTRILSPRPSDLLGQTTFVAGYPAGRCGWVPMGKACLPPGKGGGTQYVGHDKVVDLSPRTAPLQLRYRTDTQEGESGGPVWLVDQVTKQLRLVAVHRGTVSADKHNSGVLITADVIKQLRAWGCPVS